MRVVYLFGAIIVAMGVAVPLLVRHPGHVPAHGRRIEAHVYYCGFLHMDGSVLWDNRACEAFPGGLQKIKQDACAADDACYAREVEAEQAAITKRR